MRKIILFSLFLIIGLIGSQTIPTALNPEAFEKLKSFLDAMLYICLAFIMINSSSTRQSGNLIPKTIS